MAHTSIDPYRVLGLPPTATNAQITHAYRTLLRALHPDTRTGPDEFPPSPSAADATQLGEVIAAYALLRDRNRRRSRDVGPTARESTPPDSCAPGPSRQQSDTAPTRTVQVPIRHPTNTIDRSYPARPPLWAGPPVVTAYADVNPDATLMLDVMSVSWRLPTGRRS